MNSQFSKLDIVIQLESASDVDEIEKLASNIFGPGRFSRAAFRLREDVPAESELSFVAKIDQKILGSVRLTKIKIGDTPSLVLGPLMVSEEARSFGIGRELMHRSIKAAEDAGHSSIILVGDLAYYQQFGFSRIAAGKITLPGPASPDRILLNELVQGIAASLEGRATKFSP